MLPRKPWFRIGSVCLGFHREGTITGGWDYDLMAMTWWAVQFSVGGKKSWRVYRSWLVKHC